MLTTEQQEAVKGGEAVPLDVNGTPCVVVRRDVYDLAKAVLDDPDPRAAYKATLKAWDLDPDPGLAVYQKYRRKA